MLGALYDKHFVLLEFSTDAPPVVSGSTRAMSCVRKACHLEIQKADRLIFPGNFHYEAQPKEPF